MSNKRIRSRNRQGLDKVLDGHRAFINFNAQMLMSDLVDILPADKVRLEILETVDIANQDIIERLFELKKRGFKLALDDVVSGGAELEPLAWPPSSKPDQEWLDRVFAEHRSRLARTCASSSDEGTGAHTGEAFRAHEVERGHGGERFE